MATELAVGNSKQVPKHEAVLLILNVRAEEWHADLTHQPQIIGRSFDCDIVVPSVYSYVSRQHALIRDDGDGQGIWIQDLESSCGSQLNGIPLVPKLPVRAIIGDRLCLGGLELYIVSKHADVMRPGLAYRSPPEMEGTGLRLGMGRPAASIDDARLRGLSAAELEVVRWVCRGLTTFEEIAKRLFRSPHTVRTQLGSVYRKLDVHSRDELVFWFKRCETSWTQAKTDDDLAQAN